jgi:hypothetical protein
LIVVVGARPRPFGSGTRNQISNIMKSANGTPIATGAIVLTGYLPSQDMKKAMNTAEAT